MTTNFSQVSSSPTPAKQENRTVDNGNLDSCDCLWYFATDINLVILFSFICIVSIFGLVGNGAVIWLLGFRMKRTPFTTYVLNLAVADFGVLAFAFFSAVLLSLRHRSDRNLPYFSLYVMAIVLFRIMFSISQFLLTIISMDRCVAVLFPIWYRCHRPEKLPAVLCALIWIFYFLAHGILTALEEFVFEKKDLPLYVFLGNAVVCLPLILISTMVLFIRFCFNSQQHRRRKLLMAILLALLFFLFLAFPLNVMYLIHLHLVSSHEDDFPSLKVHILSVGYLCASVNSFVNPLIYFLVGLKKRGLCKENLRLILQRVFKQEEEVYGEESQPSTQSQISA
ncbi:mas-related G-protein coupled receptor member D-like [Tiliqua scincoides]|uniref:mas-related G-protein coupled receptor member D-like n=1 Tax=Tiliqua scincoides TaxID=71010 RepID=UPI0034627212